MKDKLVLFWQKYSSLVIVIAALIVLTIVFIFCIISIVKKAGNKKDNIIEPSQSQNIYEIKDESLGVTFNVDNSFERIEQKDLQAKNPYFIYGFKPKDVADVACYVSQTKRTSPGTVTPEYLKEGTFNEIKKSSPDATLDSWSTVDLGSVKGAKLDIKYKEGDKNMRQIEVVGATDKNATFSFCNSPESLYNELYKNKFDIFLNSLKLK